MIDWLKYKKIYFTISLLFILLSTFSLLKWGLNLGIDFTGGVSAEYLDKEGKLITFELPIGDYNEINNIRKGYKEQGFQELKFENVGPSIAPDSIKKTVYALVISSILILSWVTIQFKSFKFGLSAILAMLHDSFILIGMFSLFGHFFNAEVDFLFVTAILTILSFSVHDTIVVYDRIREKQKREVGTLIDLSNRAITETMVRSLNNSFTIIFMLLSLVLLGGETIRWFAVALLIGTISGTYSSPFVAVPILVLMNEVIQKIKK